MDLPNVLFWALVVLSIYSVDRVISEPIQCNLKPVADDDSSYTAMLWGEEIKRTCDNGATFDADKCQCVRSITPQSYVCPDNTTECTFQYRCLDDPDELNKVKKDTAKYQPQFAAPDVRVKDKYREITRTYHHGVEKCSQNQSSTLEERRSVCPWYWVMNNDINRVPNEFHEHKCACDECIMNCNTEDKGTCHSINYHIVVTRRNGCKKHPTEKYGLYTYANTWEPLVIGCHCLQALLVEIKKVHPPSP